MHTSKQKPVMILVHEIYGINDHMKSMIDHFDKAGFEVYCPHLLGQAKHFPYASENEAYDYFMNKVGFDESVKIVLNVAKELKTKNAERDICLIGLWGQQLLGNAANMISCLPESLDFMVQG
ncbi:dienelactone hydrolase family protein [Bacillus altitudinis]|uniref:dienelactone hydrolase family protein n=1 Tax=Bacillus altitudinis TaxID=293387 RepID=UPI0022DD5994|nr:dienelactone hydrolase family protein [Bacillus altitudinis]WBL51580.1 dienelactone hydrolase family protein [Bacillus altitudinis]